jgi:hypothetical protein
MIVGLQTSAMRGSGTKSSCISHNTDCYLDYTPPQDVSVAAAAAYLGFLGKRYVAAALSPVPSSYCMRQCWV